MTNLLFEETLEDSILPLEKPGCKTCQEAWREKNWTTFLYWTGRMVRVGLEGLTFQPNYELAEFMVGVGLPMRKPSYTKEGLPYTVLLEKTSPSDWLGI